MLGGVKWTYQEILLLAALSQMKKSVSLLRVPGADTSPDFA